MTRDEKFIRKTFTLALQSAERGFDPFAAILVKGGKEVASTTDHCILEADPTAHAELYLIRTYCRRNRLISLEGYTLYCNVEPCIMCSGAIHWARLSKVVYGVSQSTLKKVSAGQPKPDCRSLINSGGSKIDVIGPVLEEEGLKVLRMHPFQSKKERFQNYWQQP